MAQSAVSQENGSKLSQPADLKNECTEPRLFQSLKNGLFKTILPIKLSYQTGSYVSQENSLKFCLLETWTMDMQMLPVCYWLDALFSRRPDQCADASPVHCDECTLQDHLLRKSIILIWQTLSPWRSDYEHIEASLVSVTKLCLQDDLNECAEASLCQWWTPYTRPFSK